jgi:hypothetical protein
LFPELIDHQILPDLVTHVERLASESPYRILPAMIRLIHSVQVVLSPEAASNLAIRFPLEAYSASLPTYDPADVEQCLDLIALVLDPGFSNIDSFKLILDNLLEGTSFPIWAACLDFFYRRILTTNPRFFYLALYSAVILRFAWYLDTPDPLGEAYFGLLVCMSKPPPDIKWEHRARLLMSFFLNYDNAIEIRIPQQGYAFPEQEGSVLYRIRVLLQTRSPPDESLRFASRFTGEPVDLLEQAMEIVANLESLNSDVLVPIMDSQ